MFTIPELNGRMGTEKKTSTIYFYDSSSSLPAPRHLLSSKQKAPQRIPVVQKKNKFFFWLFPHFGKQFGYWTVTFCATER